MNDNKLELLWHDVFVRGDNVWRQIHPLFRHNKGSAIRVYPIPRGGVQALSALMSALYFADNRSSITAQTNKPLIVVEDPELADVFFDDIIDSGKTRESYFQRFPSVPFFALVDKQSEDLLGQWVEFPWERMTNDTGPQDNVRRLLEYIGENPNREGLLKTPDRVVNSYATLYGGYSMEPADVFTAFEDGACDEMVIARDIEFFSTCEHHMLPFFGKAHIAYIPNGKVIGVSKLARILEVFARRLQIQERLCQQVTDTLMTLLEPKGAACVLEAKHLCMIARGVNKQHSTMITSSLVGAFRDKPEARAEFLNMIGR